MVPGYPLGPLAGHAPRQQASSTLAFVPATRSLARSLSLAGLVRLQPPKQCGRCVGRTAAPARPAAPPAFLLPGRRAPCSPDARTWPECAMPAAPSVHPRPAPDLKVRAAAPQRRGGGATARGRRRDWLSTLRTPRLDVLLANPVVAGKRRLQLRPHVVPLLSSCFPKGREVGKALIGGGGGAGRFCANNVRLRSCCSPSILGSGGPKLTALSCTRGRNGHNENHKLPVIFRHWAVVSDFC